jgi:hypothetical protein
LHMICSLVIFIPFSAFVLQGYFGNILSGWPA